MSEPNQFEIIGTAKRDIKAGEPIQLAVGPGGSLMSDAIAIRKDAKLYGDYGPNLGELLREHAQ